MKTYLVGGAVRDELLGLEVGERDWVVVGATPEEMAAQAYKPVGKDFPVFLHPQSKEEYALARTERKTARGYHGFDFYTGPDVTLEDDLIRRDLTVNAIARDLQSGELVDPYNGRADLEQRVLRHVSPAFAEDPVRILRVARFYARFLPLGFSVATETLELMRQMVANGEVDALVPERVWQETRRALMQAAPQAFFQLLRDCGALEKLFPELDALFGIPQPAKHHPEIDCGVHVLMVLEQAARMQAALPVRYACLCHDFGKGRTPSFVLPAHRGHEKAGLPLVEALSKRLRVPNDCRDLALLVTEFHLHVHRALELKPATLLKLFDRLDVWRKPERFEHFLQACECDARGRTGFEDRGYPQTNYLRQALQAALVVTAQAVVADGYSGKAVGRELAKRRLLALKQFKAAS
ncbi:MAG: multifunctional CCA addition/repair protein [Nevskiales bacterium]